MTTSAQPASISSAPLTPFTEMMDYDASFAEYRALYGTEVPEDVKRKCKRICDNNLRARDGGSLVGNGFGLLEKIPYLVFSTFKNLCSGDFSSMSNIFSAVGTGFSTGNWSNLTTAISTATSAAGSALNNTNQMSVLWQLQQAAGHARATLHDSGIDPRLANILTGVQASNDTSIYVPRNSMLRQIAGRSGMTLPVDTDTSLDTRPIALTDTTPTSGLPPRASTRVLTARG